MNVSHANNIINQTALKEPKLTRSSAIADRTERYDENYTNDQHIFLYNLKTKTVRIWYSYFTARKMAEKLSPSRHCACILRNTDKQTEQ